MRKHQTLLVAGILLLATTGVAQAQAVYEVFSNAVTAREGGAAELSGNVVLFLRTGTRQFGSRHIAVFRPARKGDSADGGRWGKRSWPTRMRIRS